MLTYTDAFGLRMRQNPSQTSSQWAVRMFWFLTEVLPFLDSKSYRIV